MPIVGHGIDLIECERIARVYQNHGKRFLDRVLTAAEQERATHFADPIPHLAGRWAAKEAILKMIGTGWRGEIAWTDIEVLPNELGQPVVRLCGATGRRAEALGITNVLLSITHTREYAAASALGMT